MAYVPVWMDGLASIRDLWRSHIANHAESDEFAITYLTVRRAVIARDDYEVQAVIDAREAKMSATEQIKEFIKGLTRKSTPEPDYQRGVFKALGNGLWMAAYTNNFEDLEKEILSAKAHDRYIARLKARLVDYPELWFWHIEGTRHGQAKHIDRYGHMVVAIGEFDDTPEGREAEKHYQKHAKDYELSHGFAFPGWALQDGVYLDYNTFEISTLPAGTAANPYTSFEEISKMAVSDEQKQALRKVFGKRADSIISQVEDIDEAGKSLESLGKRFKDFADVNGSSTEDQQDTTEEGTEEQQDASANETMLSLVLESLQTVMESVNGVQSGLDQAMTRLDEEHNAATEQSKTLTEAVKEVRSLVADLKRQTPRRVDDSNGNIVDDQAAKDTVAKQQSSKQVDPFFGDMGIKIDRPDNS